MGVRNATIADAPEVADLIRQLGYSCDVAMVENKITMFSNNQSRSLVYELDHQVAAFSALHIFDMFHGSGKMGRITSFCVDEKLRGEGIGGALLKASELFLIQHGCTHIEVTTHVRRLLTPSFYIKHGYKEESRRFTKNVG